MILLEVSIKNVSKAQDLLIIILHKSDGLKDILLVQFADKGSNERRSQEQAYMHFLDFLDECSGIINFY